MSIAVNPDILIWARQSAGFDVEDAARKLGFGDSSRSTAAEKLAAMEAGEKQPTRNQLAKFANVYKRPLTTFYLANPPKTGQRGQDFRQTWSEMSFLTRTISKPRSLLDRQILALASAW